MGFFVTEILIFSKRLENIICIPFHFLIIRSTSVSKQPSLANCRAPNFDLQLLYTMHIKFFTLVNKKLH